MTLESRLARLEAAAGEGVQSIVVHGGLEGVGPDDHAHAGDRTWRRAEGEAVDAFQARVLTEAKALRARCVVWGGLPD